MTANSDRAAATAHERTHAADGGLEQLADPASIGICLTATGEELPVLALEHDATLPAGRVLVGVTGRRFLEVHRRNVRLTATKNDYLAHIDPGVGETLDFRSLPALHGATIDVTRGQDGRIAGHIRRSTPLTAAQGRGLPDWAAKAYGAWTGGTARIAGGQLHVASEPVDLTGLTRAQSDVEITAADPGGDLRSARATEALRYAASTTREVLDVSREARAAAILEAIVRHPTRKTPKDVDATTKPAALAVISGAVQQVMAAIERTVRHHPVQTDLRTDLMRAVAWRHVNVKPPDFLTRDPKTGRAYTLESFPEMLAALDTNRLERAHAITAIRFRTDQAAAHTQV